jgi:hypothetical protein
MPLVCAEFCQTNLFIITYRSAGFLKLMGLNQAERHYIRSYGKLKGLEDALKSVLRSDGSPETIWRALFKGWVETLIGKHLIPLVIQHLDSIQQGVKPFQVVYPVSVGPASLS